MALELYIPPCIHTPAHTLHLPPLERPLRIQIDGPLTSIQKLVPDASWHIEAHSPDFPMPGGIALVKLAYRALYKTDAPSDMAIRYQYLGWVREGEITMSKIDYYSVTFDHLVPADDLDPDVLQINVIEVSYDRGEYANKYLLFPVNPADYTGKKVLPVPRCCQTRKGTKDRGKTNDEVVERDRERSTGQI